MAETRRFDVAIIGAGIAGSALATALSGKGLAIALVATSAFLLNTALVAMMVPVVVDWCRRRGISPSRLLIPVSYLTILGGVCSLIGTSTTLIVNGILKQEYEKHTAVARLDTSPAAARAEHQRFVEGIRPMHLFEIGRVGLPCALSGTVVLLVFGRRLLPDRSEMIEQLDSLCKQHKGKHQLRITLMDFHNKISMPFYSQNRKVNVGNELVEALEGLGVECVVG